MEPQTNKETVMGSDVLAVKRVVMHESTGLHYHTCYEFEFLLSGSIKLQINNEVKQCCGGSFWLSRPNDIHKITNITPCFEVVSFKFKDEALSKKMRSFIYAMQTNFNGKLSEQETKGVLGVLEWMFSSYAGMKTQFDKNVFCKASFETVMTYFADKAMQLQDDVNVIGDKDIFDAVAIIKKDFKSDLTVKYFSEMFGYTPNYFSSKFKNVTGKNLIDYINNERLRYAYYMLSTTDVSVKEISVEVGFDSMAYFSRLFKKTFGISPSKVTKIVE
jgi:YesN/AraC family two-component response regulator